MHARYRFAFFALVLGAGLVTGCTDANETVYDGPLQVEFTPLANGQYAAAVPDGAGLIELTAQLIGPQQESDLSLGVAVRADETTAEAGVHFRLVDDGRFTIPANSSRGPVRVEVLDGSLAPGARRDLVLELQGDEAQEVAAAVNVNTFRLIIVGS